MTKYLLGLLAVLALVAAACGDDSGGDDTGAEGTTTATPATTAAPDDGGLDATTTAAPDDAGLDATTTAAPDDDGIDEEDAGEDPCAGATLEAGEIGVTDSTISVVVMADIGSELAPGLFQGAIDGVNAWAARVNDEGGLACRTVEVIEHDSKIDPNEGTNGYLRGCADTLAMVGTYSLFVTDVTEQTTCADAVGDPTGIPDVAGLANDPPQQCSPNTFAVVSINGSCPFELGSERDWTNQIGPHRWVLENDPAASGGANAILLVPADLPGTINSVVPGFVALRDALGIMIDGMFGVSGRAAQSEYGEFVSTATAAGSNWLQTGSDDNSMLKMLREFQAQGFDIASAVKLCTLACYTDNFGSATEVNEGTYVWSQSLPFFEGEAVPEMATFIEYIGEPQPQSWALSGWSAGLLFQRAVEQIVAADGVNGITRTRVLEELGTIDDFTANGMYGTLDLVTKTFSPCFVLMQVQSGEFARIYPEEPGTFDCDPGNVEPNTIDGLAAYEELSG